jgi:hypothetical protein
VPSSGLNEVPEAYTGPVMPSTPNRVLHFVLAYDSTLARVYS